MPRQTPVITKHRLRKMVLIQHQIISDLKTERGKLKSQVNQLEEELDRLTNGEWRSRIPWYRKILNFIVAIFKPRDTGIKP